MGKPALPLSWIHSKIISAATFCKIGLTKIAKIEFLPLDWIYRSIRIMTVCYLGICFTDQLLKFLVHAHGIGTACGFLIVYPHGVFVLVNV